MAAVTIAVEGIKVRSTSARRFHVVLIRKALPSMEVLSVAVDRRSDSLPVARKAAERSSRSASEVAVRRVFDSVAREFVA